MDATLVVGNKETIRFGGVGASKSARCDRRVTGKREERRTGHVKRKEKGKDAVRNNPRAVDRLTKRVDIPGRRENYPGDFTGKYREPPPRHYAFIERGRRDGARR